MGSERWRRRRCDGLEGCDIACLGFFEAVKDDIPFVDELRNLGGIPV